MTSNTVEGVKTLDDLKNELKKDCDIEKKREIITKFRPGLKDIINKKNNIQQWTLMHNIIKSKSNKVCNKCRAPENDNLCTVENIKLLIEEGAKLDNQEINGDTPLHTAVAIGVDSAIIDALINTKHKDCGQEPCRCGQKALQIQNNSNKTPLEIDYISESCLQQLVLEGKKCFHNSQWNICKSAKHDKNGNNYLSISDLKAVLIINIVRI